MVTGGACAQWGSDAVAGVVNLVINKRFSGVRANVSYGNSQQQDHQSFKAELSAGSDFLGGRGHTGMRGHLHHEPQCRVRLESQLVPARRRCIPAAWSAGPGLSCAMSAVSAVRPKPMAA